MSRFRRAVLASAVLVSAASIYGGCSVDDRVLSDEDLGSSGSGGGSGGCRIATDNVCEQCLYDACCDEASACGPSSACARYLDCADGCAGETTCLNGCAAESPAGFGDALALGVCSQSQCPVCSGDRGEAVASCDPNGFGACQSPGDCAALDSGALESLDVEACGADCDDLTAPACASCLSSQTGLSQPCSGCVADWLSCAVVNCVLECQVAADATACDECLLASGCNTELGTCGFSG